MGAMAIDMKKAFSPRELRRRARTFLAFSLVTALTVGTVALTPSKAYAAVPEIRTPLPQGQVVTSTAVVFEPSTVVWDTKRSSNLGGSWASDAALATSVSWDFVGGGAMVRHENNISDATAFVYTPSTGTQQSYTIPAYPTSLNGTYALYGTSVRTLATAATTTVPAPTGATVGYYSEELTASDRILWHGSGLDDAFDLFAVTSIAAGTTSPWVKIPGYGSYQATATDLLYLQTTTSALSLCRRPLSSLTSAPTCVTVATGNHTADNVVFSSLGALTLVQIQNATGTVDDAYVASASLTSVARVAVPAGSSVQGALDGFAPYLVVRDAATVPSVQKVAADGSLSAGFAIPTTVTISPDYLAVTPDRIVGADRRDGSQSALVWSRTVTGGALGAESILPARASSISASAGRTTVVGRAGTSVYDRNALGHAFPADTNLFDAAVSGPYVTQGFNNSYTSVGSHVFLADGTKVTSYPGWWPGMQFGSQSITTMVDQAVPSATHVFVTDLTTQVSANYSLPPGTGDCWAMGVWGSRIAIYCPADNSTSVYDYQTNALIGSTTGMVEAFGDGYAVVASGSTYAVWGIAADTVTPIVGCGAYQSTIATDGVGHVVCASPTELIWQDYSALATGAPRLLGILATASVSFADTSTLWTPQFDTTKALAAGSIVIKNAAGTTVRTLATPASADGSIRGVSWNGLDTAGKPVPIGTYTYQLMANAADGTSTVVSISGTGTASGTVTVIAPSTIGLGAGAVEPVSPSRVLDTRLTGGTLPSGTTRTVQITGIGGVPTTGVAAVVLNVTVTDTTAGGYLTVYPTGATRPLASNLNWSAPGSTIPNAVTVKVGTGGKVDLYQSGPGSAQVIVDIAGYYLDGAVTDAGGFISLTPARIVDTRVAGGKLAANSTRDFQVAGNGGVPSTNVSAVVLNVTVTDTTTTGYLTVFPTGATKPLASNLNWSAANTTIPNLVIAKLGTDGKISVYENGPGTAQLIIDVAGYYLGGTPTKPGTYVSLTPARVLDTRSSAAVPGLASIPLTILGAGGVPASGVSSVVINTTVTDTRVAGYLTVYPGTATAPLASNLNWTGPNVTIPNLVTTPVGTDGTIRFYNGSGLGVQVVADTAGYFIG